MYHWPMKPPSLSSWQRLWASLSVDSFEWFPFSSTSITRRCQFYMPLSSRTRVIFSTEVICWKLCKSMFYSRSLSMHLKEIAYGGSYATIDSSYYYKGQTWTTVLTSLYMLLGFELFKFSPGDYMVFIMQFPSILPAAFSIFYLSLFYYLLQSDQHFEGLL